jgi:hypothetical protein
MGADAWAAVRDRFARLFARNRDDRVQEYGEQLEAARAELHRLPSPERAQHAELERARWAGRIEALLEEHAETVAERLRKILSDLDQVPQATDGAPVVVQNVSAARDAFTSGRDQQISIQREP